MFTDNEGNERILFVHRTPSFNRSLENLRGKGGLASLMAGKAEEIIEFLTNSGSKEYFRKKFKLTWNRENRIKYCKRYNLGDGYRLICLQKGSHLVLLYVGSHDDCFRWIERNKKLTYEIEETDQTIQNIGNTSTLGYSVSPDRLKEESLFDEYEANLMSRINEDVLKKIFSGLIK